MEKEVMTFNTDSSMDIKAIPSDLFHRKEENENLHDQAFETKPVSYLRGAMMRFAKNKASIVAAIIIALLALYAIIVPIVSPVMHLNETEHPNGFSDPNFMYALPYNPINKALNLGWWDGTEVENGCSAMDLEILELDDSNHSPLVENIETVKSRSSQVSSSPITNSASILTRSAAKRSTSLRTNTTNSSLMRRSRASTAPKRAS